MMTEVLEVRRTIIMLSRETVVECPERRIIDLKSTALEDAERNEEKFPESSRDQQKLSTAPSRAHSRRRGTRMHTHPAFVLVAYQLVDMISWRTISEQYAVPTRRHVIALILQHHWCSRPGTPKRF